MRQGCRNIIVYRVFPDSNIQFVTSMDERAAGRTPSFSYRDIADLLAGWKFPGGPAVYTCMAA